MNSFEKELNSDKVISYKTATDIGRPPDDPPKGGEKGRTTDTINISPYVAENISDYSFEELRTSTERQFRALADITRDLLITTRKLEERVAALESTPPPLEVR